MTTDRTHDETPTREHAESRVSSSAAQEEPSEERGAEPSWPQAVLAAWRSVIVLVFATGTCVTLVVAVLLLTSTVDREAKSLGVKRERDTRLMLVHELRSRWVCKADGLVVGSSRARVLGHLVVDGQRFYSLTANGMAPREFAGYVDAWVNRCGKHPKVVLLGLDFFGSSLVPMVPAPTAAEYTARRRSIAQRLGVFELLSTTRLLEAVNLLLDGVHQDVIVDAMSKELDVDVLGEADDEDTNPAADDGSDGDESDGDDEGMTLDALEGDRSAPWFETARYRDIPARDVPRRDVDATCLVPRIKPAPSEKIALAFRPARFRHSKIYEDVYRQYRPDPRYADDLRALQRRYPDTRFVGFVTPTTHVLFALLVDMGRLPDYEAFLRATIEGLGEVWEFGGLNSVTARRSNFVDENHLTPRAADVMAAKALGSSGSTAEAAPADFGIRLDPSNVDAYVESLRERVAAPRVPRSSARTDAPASMSYEAISSRRTANHERRGDCGVPLGKEGIEIDVREAKRTRRIDVGVHARVTYRVEYLGAAGKLLGRSTIAPDLEFGEGAHRVMVEVPKPARGKNLRKIRVKATRGPKSSRFLGHLRFR